MSQHPLYIALKGLAGDLRKLFHLATHEDADSWNNFISIVRKELDEKEVSGKRHKDEELLYASLIREVYDHLTLLIHTLKKSEERYKKLATRDLLTGLYNRNYFNETIVRDIKKAERKKERLSFILIDIDGFKKINDTFGHLHGDGVLQECAHILKKSVVRKSDFLCRYGGDEFIIITPEQDCAVNDKLLNRIEKHLDEWNNKYSSFDYRLSLSIGCAVWKPGDNFMETLHEADKRMYANKRKTKKK
jgi:diguanylate cyclase (GGDEF)-like protein